jgi:DNA-binding transcriptional LysR family regulator
MAEAARRLNLTRAAVAQRLHALEAEMGTTLIVRAGRTVRPTEAGAAIIERVRKLINDARDLKSLAATEVPTGELRLGAMAPAITGLLPNVLARLTREHPRMDVYIRRGTSSDLYHQVLDGELDAAIIIDPPFPIPKACDWRVIREEHLLVLAPAAMKGRDPLDLLANEPFIRWDRNNWTGQLVERYLRRRGIRPRERFELAGIESIATLVDRGLGVALVPDSPPPWPEGLALAKLPVPDESFTRRIGLIWTRTSARIRLVHTFIQEATKGQDRHDPGKPRQRAMRSRHTKIRTRARSP